MLLGWPSMRQAERLLLLHKVVPLVSSLFRILMLSAACSSRCSRQASYPAHMHGGCQGST